MPGLQRRVPLLQSCMLYTLSHDGSGTETEFRSMQLSRAIHADSHIAVCTPRGSPYVGHVSWLSSWHGRAIMQMLACWRHLRARTGCIAHLRQDLCQPNIRNLPGAVPRQQHIMRLQVKQPAQHPTASDGCPVHAGSSQSQWLCSSPDNQMLSSCGAHMIKM